MTDALIASRKAAHAMNQLCKELGLGNLAYHFDGDNPEDWAVHSNIEIIALKYDKRVAEVHLYGNGNVQVVVPDAYMLIRPGRVRDFDPYDYGITIQTAYDFKGDKVEPDIRANWILPDDLPLDGPRRYTPRTTLRRKPRAIGSLNQ